MGITKVKPDVVAVYCPLWHNYDHASSWKGEEWCEGCYLLPEKRHGLAFLETVKKVFI